eukprot:scaffold4157_cov136-Cylindrotheca_fusiformis.AAC.29
MSMAPTTSTLHLVIPSFDDALLTLLVQRFFVGLRQCNRVANCLPTLEPFASQNSWLRDESTWSERKYKVHGSRTKGATTTKTTYRTKIKMAVLRQNVVTGDHIQRWRFVPFGRTTLDVVLCITIAEPSIAPVGAPSEPSEHKLP